MWRQLGCTALVPLYLSNTRHLHSLPPSQVPRVRHPAHRRPVAGLCKGGWGSETRKFGRLACISGCACTCKVGWPAPPGLHPSAALKRPPSPPLPPLQHRWPTPLWGASRCSTAAWSARRRSQWRWVGGVGGGGGVCVLPCDPARTAGWGTTCRRPLGVLTSKYPELPSPPLLPSPPPPPRCLSSTTVVPAAGCAWASPTRVAAPPSPAWQSRCVWGWVCVCGGGGVGDEGAGSDESFCIGTFRES